MIIDTLQRGSKAGSLFDGLSVSTSEAENAQEYITQRFTQIEDYLDSLTEDFTQDLEREQQHLILMQEQVVLASVAARQAVEYLLHDSESRQ